MNIFWSFMNFFKCSNFETIQFKKLFNFKIVKILKTIQI
jgi:hypothetical protein